MRVGFLLVLALLCFSAEAKFVNRDFQIRRTEADWHFVEKFCFDDSGQATLAMRATTTDANVTQQLLFYNDFEERGWPYIYNSKMTCEERVSPTWAPASDFLRPMSDGTEDNPYINFLQYIVPKAQRPRFWYIVYAACGGADVDLHIEMEFLNANRGTNQHHFSCDEQGLLEVYSFFACVYFVFSCFLLVLLYQLDQRNKLTPVHGFVVASFICEIISIHTKLGHWAQLSGDGIGSLQSETAGKLFHILAQLIFMFTLLLVARGWTITTSKLSRKRYLAGYLACLIAIYVGVFIWDATRDRSATLYVYESWPGFALLLMHWLILILFWVLLLRTYSFEKRSPQRYLYRWLGIIYTFWFMQLPLTITIAHFMEPWNRRRIVESIDIAIQALGYFLLPALSKPGDRYASFSSELLFHGRIAAINKQRRVLPSSAPDVGNSHTNDGLRGHNPMDIEMPNKPPTVMAPQSKSAGSMFQEGTISMGPAANNGARAAPSIVDHRERDRERERREREREREEQEREELEMEERESRRAAAKVNVDVFSRAGGAAPQSPSPKGAHQEHDDDDEFDNFDHNTAPKPKKQLVPEEEDEPEADAPAEKKKKKKKKKKDQALPTLPPMQGGGLAPLKPLDRKPLGM